MSKLINLQNDSVPDTKKVTVSTIKVQMVMTNIPIFVLWAWCTRQYYYGLVAGSSRVTPQMLGANRKGVTES